MVYWLSRSQPPFRLGIETNDGPDRPVGIEKIGGQRGNGTPTAKGG